jgi:hypothetical protein
MTDWYHCNGKSKPYGAPCCFPSATDGLLQPRSEQPAKILKFARFFNFRLAVISLPEAGILLTGLPQANRLLNRHIGRDPPLGHSVSRGC